MRPLSPAQSGIWAGLKIADDKSIYNTAECLFFSGKVDIAMLTTAIQVVVSEAECLSCHYLDGPNQRGARLSTAQSVKVERQPLTEKHASLARIRAWAHDVELATPFLLATELPCRFTLFEGLTTDILYMAAHHIALDGFGYTLFWHRLASVYDALSRGLTPPPSPFAPFAAIFDGQDGDKQEAREFWRQRLAMAGAPALLTPSMAPLTRGYNQTVWTIPPDLWQRVLKQAAQSKVSWVDICVANLALLIRRRSNAPAFTIGMPIMNRESAASLRVPCMQMNIIPLCLSVDDHDTLSSLTQRIHDDKKTTRKYQAYRYEAMQRDRQSASTYDRLFGVVVNILPFTKALNFGPLRAEKHVICAGPVSNLSLAIHYQSSKIEPHFEFTGPMGTLSPVSLERIQEEFAQQLELWLDNPSTTALELIEMSRANNRQRFLLGNVHPAPTDADIIGFIVEHSRHTPSHIAIEQDGRRLTYADLIKRVDTWAGALIAGGVQPREPVGVMLNRSLEAIIAALAVLRAGGCYVPLDKKQPRNRQEQILQQLPLRHLIVDDESLPTELPVQHVWSYRQLDSGAPGHRSPAGEDTAYILFTSGSTGKPKGVAISFGSLSFFVHAANTRYLATPRDRILQFAPFSFDTSIEEIFLALSHGATLVLRDDSALESLQAFAEALDEAKITILDLPTAYWSEWTEALSSGLSYVPPHLHTIILGGEAVYPGRLKKWFAVGGERVRLINSYGPTETTIVATTVDLTPAHVAQAMDAIAIGLPLPGVGALVLDPCGNPVDEGELVIVGPTVGSHYLGSTEDLQRPLRIGGTSWPSYRTGDRVRLIDGALTFVGRIDNEFKISGYRVHPSEVESQFLQIPGIAEACVHGLIDAQGRRRLVAFVGTKENIDPKALRANLQASLPLPLVPSSIEVMRGLPKTRSGKIDRKALVARATSTAQKQPPPHQAEQASDHVDNMILTNVKAVWREELGPINLDHQDTFYRVGGDSLQLLQVSLRLSQKFGRTIPTADVLRFPVLADFCRHLEELLADDTQQEPIYLVALGGGEGHPRTYCFPGIYGNASQFADLAKCLAPTAHVMAIETMSMTFHSLESWAEACAALILREDKQSSCRLIGHSFGGCLAYEVARILEAKGLAVDLCLLDTYFQLDRSDMNIEERLATLMHTYHPTALYSGKATLIYARDTTHYDAKTLAVARRQDAALFPLQVKSHDVAGDHFSLLNGDNAAAIARLL